MEFIDDKVIEILQRLPSECPYIDYKLRQYKDNQKHDFLRDVIAMLNSEAAIGMDKFIIVGVEDTAHQLIGIEPTSWKDDNEWQNLIDVISPRPDVRTGTVEYDGKTFGFVYISPSNDEWVYEASKSIISSNNDPLKERNILAKGQAYTRLGSRNNILLEEGRRHLLEKKIQRISFEKPRNINIPKTNIFLVVGLIGSWNESFIGDIELIERLSGADFDDFTSSVRKKYEEDQSFLAFSNHCWKVTNHKDLLVSEASGIYDEHIERFCTLLLSCMQEVEPKYNLSSEKRYAASVYLKDAKKEYSALLRRGMCETIAILGNNQALLVNCSRNKWTNAIYQFERSFFRANDWKIYATTADELEFLGEAYPDVFMNELTRLVDSKDEAFVTFLSEKETGITTTQYGYQLSWVLSNIAKLERYFSKAISVLLRLAKYNNQFLDAIVGVVLPWFPQTHAPLKVRTGIFNGMALDDEELTWKILMKLMPKVTMTCSPIQKPKYLEVKDIPEGVSRQDYETASIDYIKIALGLVGTNTERMCEMLSVIDGVDVKLQEEILNTISEGVLGINQKDKEKLWNAIQDLLCKHKKFSEAEWALGEERLSSISECADSIFPDNRDVMAIRIFRRDQYKLYEKRGNYREEDEKLRDKQVDCLKYIYHEGGIDSVVRFVEQVENKNLVGRCLVSIINDEDVATLIMYSKNILDDPLLKGLLPSLPFSRVQKIVSGFNDLIKAQTSALFSLNEDMVKSIDLLTFDSQSEFWKNVDVWRIQSDNVAFAESAVRKLNEYHRTDKSILIFYELISDKCEDISARLVADTLILNVENQSMTAIDIYHVQQLIKWLQEDRIDSEVLVTIEWKYLVFLGEDEEVLPVNIWNELSSNPMFFVNTIKLMCGKNIDFEGSKEEKEEVASQCYRLLNSWKRVPGTNNDGNVDSEKLREWIETVKQETKECGLEKLAMKYLGQSMFYSPQDNDGFFISRKIAYYLQSDKDGSILSGYRAEAYNSRGIHIVDPTGEADFMLERQYSERAKVADENGMYRLADTLRSIADSFHDEGLINIEDDKRMNDFE